MRTSFRRLGMLMGILAAGAGLGPSPLTSQAQPVYRPVQIVAGAPTPGFADGMGTNAQFTTNITGIAVDGAGNLYVADAGNLRVRKILPSGEVRTLAGTGISGTNDGPGVQALFSALKGLTIDSQGNCYVIDSSASAQKVRKITPDGTVSTFLSEPTPPHHYNSITVRTNDELVVYDRVAGDFDTLNALSTLRSDGTKSQLFAVSTVNGKLRPEVIISIASGLSTNLFFDGTWDLGAQQLSADIFQTISSLGLSGVRTRVIVCTNAPGAFHVPRAQLLGAGLDGKAYIDWMVFDTNTLNYTREVRTVDANGVPNVVWSNPPWSTYGGMWAVDKDGTLYCTTGSQIIKAPAYKGLTLATSSQGGGTVAVDTPSPYFSNTVVRVTVTPLPGWTFLSWLGDAMGAENSLLLTLDANKWIQARFGAPLIISPASGGGATVQPDLPLYAYGQTVTASAKPDPGFGFVRWTDGVITGSRTVTITNLITLQPVFAALPTFMLDAAVLGGAGGTITTQPNRDTFFQGSTVTLTASPSPGYVFQTWLDNDQTNPRTVFMTSNTVLFAVFAPGQPKPPSIIAHPADTTVLEGGTVRLTASVRGGSPFVYAWWKDDQPIPGATTPELSIADATIADAGRYKLVARNSLGTASTFEATVRVGGLVARWDLDGNAADSGGLGIDGVTHAVSRPGDALGFDGTSSFVEIPNAPALNFGGNITLAAWIRPSVLEGRHNIIAHGYTLDPGAEVVLRLWDGHYEVGSWKGGIDSYGTTTPTRPADAGNWVHIAGTYDGTAWSLYRNGILVAREIHPVGAVPVGAGWAIGANSTGTERLFKGLIDDVRIYNVALNIQQIQKIASRSSGSPAWVGITKTSRGLSLRLEGLTGQRYQVEGSTDLKSWTSVTTAVTLGDQGWTSFELPSANPGPAFYRAIQIPNP